MDIREGKLIQLLAKIEESELKALMKFVKSPYHNSNKQIIPLLEKLLTYHPKFDYKKLTKEFLFRQIHPKGKPYHEGRMNLLMTNLVSVMQKFYRQQEFEQDQLLQKKLLGKAYNKRGFYKKYKKEVDGMLALLENSPYREEDYFFQKYDIQQEFFFHIETPTGPDGAVLLYDAIDDLDDFYLTAKLTLVAEQFTITKRLNTKKEVKFLDSIFEYLEENEMKHSSVIQFYHKFLRLRKFGYVQKDYEKVKRIFIENMDRMDLLTQKLIYYNLVNYVVNLNNQAKKSFWEELVSLYKFGLNKKFVLTNNIITVGSYFNIAFSASFVGEFDWSEKFINEYEKYLIQNEVSNQMKLMTLAFCSYHRGLKDNREYFFKTLEYIREINYSRKSIALFIKARALWVRCCFEIMKFDRSYLSIINNYINSFEKQLTENKTLSTEYINRNLLSLQYIKKLIQFHENDDVSNLTLRNFKKEVEEGDVATFKDWIIEKIEELQTI